MSARGREVWGAGPGAKCAAARPNRQASHGVPRRKTTPGRVAPDDPANAARAPMRARLREGRGSNPWTPRAVDRAVTIANSLKSF